MLRCFQSEDSIDPWFCPVDPTVDPAACSCFWSLFSYWGSGFNLVAQWIHFTLLGIILPTIQLKV